MRDVYAIASEVVAILGDENNDDNGDLSLAARFAADIADAKPDLPPETRNVADHLRHGGGRSPWSGLFNMLRRPWFSRIWVVQEALVARKLSFQCGAASIAAPKLAELSHVDCSEAASSVVKSPRRDFWGSTLSSVRFIRKVASRELVAAHTKQKADLLELLWTHRGYKATKARDHLFAILGLANVPYNSLLSPDYESCLEVIVNRYARYFVQLTPNHSVYYIPLMAFPSTTGLNPGPLTGHSLKELHRPS
jgi:Heterokaryon incompatibility protein (HET)